MGATGALIRDNLDLGISSVTARCCWSQPVVLLYGISCHRKSKNSVIAFTNLMSLYFSNPPFVPGPLLKQIASYGYRHDI